MPRRLVSAMLVLCACGLDACGPSASSVKPDPRANATTTPAERFAQDQKRRQQELEERQRREEFMNRMNSRRR
jgi:hypothetical protein